MTVKVSFMFLGGLPDLSKDNGKAWKKFFQYSDPEYFKNIVIVTHPIKNRPKIDPYWDSFNLIILKDQKHLKTAWATRSLVDATILMLHTSYKKYPKIQKFILLDSKTCPLYNLETIYDTILLNNNNWLDPIRNKCKNIQSTGTPVTINFCDEEYCITREDCSIWSQWMILDASSIKSILHANIYKNLEDVTCKSSALNIIEVPDEEDYQLQHNLSQMLNEDGTPCNSTDELFFGMYLKQGKTINEFMSTIQSIPLFRFKLNYDVVQDIKSQVTYVKPFINIRAAIDVPFDLVKVRFNDVPIKDDLYALPSTYVDWRHINPNPFNLFRSFNYPGFDIKDYLNNPNTSDAINTLLESGIKGQTFESLKLNHIPYWAHPVEYNSVPLFTFINGYNILVYLHNNNKSDYHLAKLYHIYVMIFEKFKGIKYTQLLNYTFAEATTSKKAGSATGTYIKAEVLNAARSKGALFIRKCEDGSLIHKYARQLYKKNPDPLPYKIGRDEEIIKRLVLELSTLPKEQIKLLESRYDTSGCKKLLKAFKDDMKYLPKPITQRDSNLRCLALTIYQTDIDENYDL